MPAHDFAYLLERYARETISPEELTHLRKLILEETDAAGQEQAIGALMHQQLFTAELPVSKDEMFARIMEESRRRGRIRIARYWWAAAAVLLLVMAAGIYWWMPANRPAVEVKQDVAPGSQKATLTLGDGSVVELDSTGNGIIAQGIRQQGGQLRYEGASAVSSYNVLSTPRGGQFRLQLPDGTQVWLNAASSIKYPTAFTGKERIVEVSGEAYFEVAQDALKPFKVGVNGEKEVTVLGTSFNINAYKNEPQFKATLLEGSIKVGNTLLRPGEQLVMEEGTSRAARVNINRVMAWKNGFFNFDGLSLRESMRQLERWYDIEVVYEGDVPDIQFFGEISRDLSLAGLLRTLEAAEVHFRIEAGRKLIVMP